MLQLCLASSFANVVKQADRAERPKSSYFSIFLNSTSIASFKTRFDVRCIKNYAILSNLGATTLTMNRALYIS